MEEEEGADGGGSGGSHRGLPEVLKRQMRKLEKGLGGGKKGNRSLRTGILNSMKVGMEERKGGNTTK